MSNKVTPRLKTVRVPGAEWIYLDIGLWPSQGNEMTIMAYYQFKPGHWRPVAAPIDSWELALSKMTELWNEFGCSCKSDPCDACRGTGWKHFVRWEAAGQQVDAEGYPVLPRCPSVADLDGKETDQVTMARYRGRPRGVGH